MTRRRSIAAVVLGLLVAQMVLAGAALATTGDVNGDGRIDLADALALCRELSGEGGPVADPAAADADDDGAVDVDDLVLLLLAALGQPLPVRTYSVVPNELEFLNVLVGTTLDLDVVVTSNGTVPVTVSGISLDPAGSAAFSLIAPPTTPQDLGPGENITITVRYAPTAAGADIGSLELLTNAGDRTIPLTAIAISPLLDVSPLVIDYDQVAVGQTEPRTITLLNIGTATLNVNSVALGPASSPDFAVGAPSALLIAPGDNATVTVSYTPGEVGDDTGEVEVLTDGGDATVGLFGSGVQPALDLVPETVDFGSVLVGDAGQLSFEIRNTGTASLSVGQVVLGLGTDPDFALGAFPATPFTILAGESQAVPVSFTPGDSGPAAGTVEVQTDAGSGTVQLLGAGVRPEITLTPGTVDFGNVLVGAGPVVDVEIGNNGTADLDISSVVLTSGTSSDFDFDTPPATPASVAPGGSLTVAIRYLPGEVGVDAGAIEIASNDPDLPLASVPLLGNGVVQEFVLQPTSLDYGSVLVNAPADDTFEILNSGLADLDVVSVAVNPAGDPAFSIPAPPGLPQTLTPGQMLTVTVRFGPAATGPAAGSVDVGTSAGTGEVLLQGNGIAPAVEVTPAALDFGEVPAGGALDLSLVVGNGGTAALEVTSAALLTGSDAEFSIPVPPTLPATVPVGGNLTVDVRFAPAAGGTFGGTLRIGSDDPFQPALDVPLSGDGVEGAFLVASPSTVDFGNVPVGTPAEIDITLTNEGDGALTILSSGLATGSSGDLSVGSPSATALDPAQSATVHVTYLPSAEGPDSGALEVVTTANTVNVPLAGNGVVDVVPVALSLNVTAETLYQGECLQLRAIVEFSDSSTASFTSEVAWGSSNPAAATVNAAGLIETGATGATIVSGDYLGLSGQASITVERPGSVRLLMPCGEVVAGTSFGADLMADVADLPLGAYAVRVVYDPAVLNVVSINGAASGFFSGTPFSDPSGYAGGASVLAAFQAGSLSSPTGEVPLAGVQFQVVGAPGASGVVAVEVIDLVGTDLGAIPHSVTPSRFAVRP